MFVFAVHYYKDVNCRNSCMQFRDWPFMQCNCLPVLLRDRYGSRGTYTKFEGPLQLFNDSHLFLFLMFYYWYERNSSNIQVNTRTLISLKAMQDKVVFLKKKTTKKHDMHVYNTKSCFLILIIFSTILLGRNLLLCKLYHIIEQFFFNIWKSKYLPNTVTYI